MKERSHGDDVVEKNRLRGQDILAASVAEQLLRTQLVAALVIALSFEQIHSVSAASGVEVAWQSVAELMALRMHGC